MKSVMVSLVIVSITFTGCHDDGDEDKQKLETELKEQRQITERWMMVAGALGISCTVLFGVGVAIGSKARKQVNRT